jgi:hypothetical protein
LGQQADDKAEGIRKLDVQLEAQRTAHEESLRQTDREAVAALDLKLKAQRLESPAKAKLPNSPARTPAAVSKAPATVPQTPGTVADELEQATTMLGHRERELIRTENAIKERRKDLEVIKHEGTAFNEKRKAELAKVNEEKVRAEAELARINDQKERAEIALASTMSESEYAAFKEKRQKELEQIRAENVSLTTTRVRIEAEVKGLRKERDAGKPSTAATPAKKDAGARHASELNKDVKK